MAGFHLGFLLQACLGSSSSFLVSQRVLGNSTNQKRQIAIDVVSDSISKIYSGEKRQCRVMMSVFVRPEAGFFLASLSRDALS